MSPYPALSPVHAHRVYQVDVLIGRACSVRPYVLCRRLTAPHPTPNRSPRLAPLGGCSARARSPYCNAHYMWYARTPMVIRPMHQSYVLAC